MHVYTGMARHGVFTNSNASDNDNELCAFLDAQEKKLFERVPRDQTAAQEYQMTTSQYCRLVDALTESVALELKTEAGKVAVTFCLKPKIDSRRLI